MLSGTPGTNPSCALRSNTTRWRVFRGARASLRSRRRSGETACCADTEPFFLTRPGIRHRARGSAGGDQLAHRFDNMPEIKFRDAVALKIGSGIQEIDGVGHALLDCELDRIHLVSRLLLHQKNHLMRY